MENSRYKPDGGKGFQGNKFSLMRTVNMNI